MDKLGVVVNLVEEFHLVNDSAIALLRCSVSVDFVLVLRVVFGDRTIDLTELKLYRGEAGYVPGFCQQGGANVFHEESASFEVDDVEWKFQVDDFVFVVALWGCHIYNLWIGTLAVWKILQFQENRVWAVFLKVSSN